MHVVINGCPQEKRKDRILQQYRRRDGSLLGKSPIFIPIKCMWRYSISHCLFLHKERKKKTFFFKIELHRVHEHVLFLSFIPGWAGRQAGRPFDFPHKDIKLWHASKQKKKTSFHCHCFNCRLLVITIVTNLGVHK